MPSLRPRFLPLLAALSCSAPAGVARAYEDQYTLGLGAGYAQAVSNSLPRHGAQFDVNGSVGLGPVFSLRGRLSYAFHPADQPLNTGLVGAELLYLIDIVELVPYFGVGLDGVGRARSSNLELDAAAHLVVGIDYLISRKMILGLDLRSHLLFTALDRDPFYVSLIVSASWIFER